MAARSIVEKYYQRLDVDFDHNLLVVQDAAIIHSKRLRNKVAGYVTRLYKCVQKGTAKRIYIKQHEEERERKEAYIPKDSIVDIERLDVDQVTYDMIKQYCYRGNYKVLEGNLQA